MIQYLAALPAIISLFIYAILFSIECGATLFVFAPGLLGAGEDGDRMVRGYVNPAWEATNVFLIFALLWLIAFFPVAVPVWGHALILPFLLFLIIMGIRSVGMLYVFYKEGTNRVIKLLLVVASFAAPMALAGGVLPFFITGITPYGATQLFLAFHLACVAFFATLFISSSFFRYLAARNKLRTTGSLDSLTFGAMIAFIAIIFLSFLAFKNIMPRIASGTQAYLPLIAALAIINLIFAPLPTKRCSGARFVLALALFGATFFAIMLAQLPYVIYPAMTVFSTFTDPASAKIMLEASGIAAIVILPSLGLLYHLVTTKKDPD
jgi:cytochrome d ubiquinol oxidase subunit II